MEKVIELLEQKGFVKRTKLTIEIITKISNVLRNKEVSEKMQLDSVESILKGVESKLKREFERDEEIGNAMKDYMFKSIAKEVINIINKEEKKND